MPYGELPLIKTTDGRELPGFPVSIPNPPKSAVLRLPTPDELLTYLGAQKSLSRDLGRRQTEDVDIPNPAADQKLFRAIRMDGGANAEEWDDAEALYAIGLITRHRVTDCSRDGNGYVVTLETLFGPTTHTVSIPLQKDLMEYRRDMYKTRNLPHGVTEQRFPPEVPVRLYDKIMTATTGYTEGTPVPPHHKRSVINELVLALQSLDPTFDPNS